MSIRGYNSSIKLKREIEDNIFMPINSKRKKEEKS